MRAVHPLGRVERGVRVIENRRDQIPAVLPVHQIGGGIDLDAPGPDSVLAVGVFLVLAVPVVNAVLIKHRAAVRLDALAFGVEPGAAGVNSVLGMGAGFGGAGLVGGVERLKAGDLLGFARADGVFRRVQRLQGGVQRGQGFGCLGDAAVARKLFDRKTARLGIRFRHRAQPGQEAVQRGRGLRVLQQIGHLHLNVIAHGDSPL